MRPRTRLGLALLALLTALTLAGCPSGGGTDCPTAASGGTASSDCGGAPGGY
jgi:hypothetical protein